MSLLMQMTGGAEPPVTGFQVLGERSSGTNYVVRLLRRNLDIRQSGVLGWKHGFPHMLAIPPGLMVIASFREPLAWVRSMYAKPWHTTAQMQRMTFPDFIRAPWDTIVDRAAYFGLPKGAQVLGQPLQFDRDPLTGARFTNLMRLRTAKARALLGMALRTDRLVLAAFEAVLEHPEAFLAEIAARYGVVRKGGYAPIERRLGQKFKPAVSDRPPVPAEISAEDIAFIRSQLDPEVEARLGYAV